MNKYYPVIVAVIIFYISSTAYALDQCQLQRLFHEDGEFGDGFGIDVAMDGDFVAIGAPYDKDALGNITGSVTIYRNNGIEWVEEQKLFPMPNDFSEFGQSVALSGNELMVGAIYDPESAAYAIVVYYYRFDGIAWIERQKIVIPEVSNYVDVDLDENIAIIGAAGVAHRVVIDGYLTDVFNSGAAYIYRYDGKLWNQERRIVLSYPRDSDRFGISVVVDGKYVVVGAPGQDDISLNHGSAYVYDNVFLDLWRLRELTPSNINPNIKFGESVSIHDQTVFVGVPGSDERGNDAGSVVVFEHGETGWFETQTITSPSDDVYRGFGTEVVVKGDQAIITQPLDQHIVNGSGAAFYYQYNGKTWEYVSKLIGLNAVGYGLSVDFSGDLAVIGAYRDDFNSISSGLAYITDFVSVDVDQDEFADMCDNCPYVANPMQTDTNEDGVGDYCQDDDDGDGVDDVVDNCPLLVNPDQLDTDQNGIGDPCQEQPCQAQSLYSPFYTRNYGSYVYLNGNRAFVLTSTHDENWDFYEAINYFEKVEDNWVHIQEFTSAEYMRSGLSKSLTGIDDMLVVCDPGLAAIIFRYDGQQWVEDQNILPLKPLENYWYCKSVSLENDWLVLGSISDGHYPENVGKAYIYRFDGESYKEQQILTPSDELNARRYGYKVSMNRGNILIGESIPFSNSDSHGRVYAYRFNETQWEETQILKASDFSINDRFGCSIAQEGNRAVIGAVGSDAQGVNAGAAYVFHFDGNQWVEEQILVSSEFMENSGFGRDVAILGDVILINGSAIYGSYGTVFIFQYDGVRWVETAKLTGQEPMGYDNFGSALSIDGDSALIGAYGTSTGFWSEGAAYIFTLSGVDLDYDGIYDSCDNCTGTFNPLQQDCNFDGAGDVCAEYGDFDADGIVGEIDVENFIMCMNGVNLSPFASLYCADVCLQAFDFDLDNDLDLQDFSVIQNLYQP